MIFPKALDNKRVLCYTICCRGGENISRQKVEGFMRKFEEVRDEFKVFPGVKTKLPERSDSRSAGYDLHSKEDYVLQPGESHTFWTDVCATMFFDNVMFIFARSGLGCKKGVVPRNCVGVIDPSYYGNSSTGGNLAVCLENNGDEPLEVKIGDRIAQIVYCRYLVTDDDRFLSQKTDKVERTGGFGSTGR